MYSCKRNLILETNCEELNFLVKKFTFFHFSKNVLLHKYFKGFFIALKHIFLRVFKTKGRVFARISFQWLLLLFVCESCFLIHWALLFPNFAILVTAPKVLSFFWISFLEFAQSYEIMKYSALSLVYIIFSRKLFFFTVSEN